MLKDEKVRDSVRVLARLSRVLESSESGLTLPQYRMLSALSEGGHRSARLAERLAIRKPTATALADGLVAAGYAEREGEAGDRRIVRLRITPAGQTALGRADAAYVANLGPILEQPHLVEALLAVGLALDARAAALSSAHASTAGTGKTAQRPGVGR